MNPNSHKGNRNCIDILDFHADRQTLLQVSLGLLNIPLPQNINRLAPQEIALLQSDTLFAGIFSGLPQEIDIIGFVITQTPSAQTSSRLKLSPILPAQIYIFFLQVSHCRPLISCILIQKPERSDAARPCAQMECRCERQRLKAGFRALPLRLTTASPATGTPPRVSKGYARTT